MTYCNYENIAREVAQAAQDAGRPADSVQLIAVSKTVGNDAVAAAIAAGATDFGENRPDCLIEKAQANPQVNWHFIGHIQSRRIPDIVQHATLIHSLYRLKHAEKINAAAARAGKVQDVLIEVNVSGEESKDGCTPDEAKHLVRAIQDMPNVRARGLMTMAPIALSAEDGAVIYETFEGLRKLRDTIQNDLRCAGAECSAGAAHAEGSAGDASVQVRGSAGAEESAAGAAGAAEQAAKDFSQLSMGMSGDWRCAVECGATMVRIGRAIFQPQE